MQPIKSIDLLEKYLSERGYLLRRMTLGQSPHSKFVMVESPSGKSITLSVSKLSYPFAASAAREIINNKIRAHDFSRQLGIPVPDTMHVSADAYNLDDIRGMLKKHKQLIVKPHNGFQSRGLTIDITSEAQLVAAIERAAQISTTVLIQEQFYGEEVRLIAVDAVVRAALLRQKPHIVGDGISTIAMLIEKENLLRSKIEASLVAYPALDEKTVAATLLNSNRIPKAGEVVELNRSTMIRGGASVYNISSSIDPSYIAIAEEAAKKFGKGFVSVDFMIKDYKIPAQSDNYVFIEFNSGISLPMCYSCRDGKNFKIIEEYIGPMMERAIG